MPDGSPSDYRYDHITSQMFKEHMHFGEGVLAPGEPMPDAQLYTPDAQPVLLHALAAQSPILLIAGSISCPMTAASFDSVQRLHERFGRQVTFVMLNVREAHPGESIPQPQRFADKLRHAAELKDRLRIPFDVLSDDIDGTLHQRLGGLPNAAFLFDRNGKLAFRCLWAGDEASLRQALDAVARGDPPVPTQSERKFVPMAQGIGQMHDTLERAGNVAIRDVWREAPPIALMASLARAFSPLPPIARTMAAAAVVVTIVVGVPALLITNWVTKG